MVTNTYGVLTIGYDLWLPCSRCTANTAIETVRVVLKFIFRNCLENCLVERKIIANFVVADCIAGHASGEWFVRAKSGQGACEAGCNKHNKKAFIRADS